MAKGLFETTKWFMGDDIPQYGYLCLEPDDKIEEFDKKVEIMIKEMDTGDGVIIFTDLLGGTPCNRCIQFMSNKVNLIAGMNLAIVLEQLGKRLFDDYDFNSLIQIAREGLVHLNEIKVEDEDNFLD